MRKFSQIAAAVLAVNGFGIATVALAQGAPPVDTAQTTVDRTVDKSTEVAPDAEGIRDLLAQVAEASLTKDGLNDLVERFVDADRNRLGQNMPKDDQLTELNGRIAQFHKDWKEKYGSEFDIHNEEMTYGAVAIIQGEIDESARLAGEISRNADGVDTNVDNQTGVDLPRGEGVAGAEDKNLNDPGRNIASVVFPASGDLPEIRVPLIHEMPDSWRIDIPDELDAPTLQQNLLKHLTMANEQKAQWPGNVNEAEALVTHHVLLAIFEGSPNVQQGEMKLDQPAEAPAPTQ